jgi:serine/threonine protein kinase
MHDAGVVHRDLKLEIILMSTKDDNDSLPKISDFGLATMIGPGQKIREFCGTITYCSPEIVKHKAFGKKADVWSLGVIICALLTGFMPFDGEDDKEVARAIAYTKIDFKDPAFGSLGDEEKKLIECKLSCANGVVILEKDMEKRPTIEEVMKLPLFKDFS